MSKSLCISPFEKDGMKLPCGRCSSCKAKRASAWSFRLYQEWKISSSAYFVTLTYDEQNVPLTHKNFMTLNKRDIQLFMKRLRKNNEEKIKYYCAGEYGSTYLRPHYHIIMFNVDLATLIGKRDASFVFRKQVKLNGDIQYICPIWGNGYITVGEVSEASIGYTLKYISKSSRIPMFKGDDRISEFSLMSKGLGKSYALNRNIRRWHKQDAKNRLYCTTKDGKKIAMPRYYKQKIYGVNQLIRIHSYIINKQRDEWDNLLPEERLYERIKLYGQQKLAEYRDEKSHDKF